MPSPYLGKCLCGAISLEARAEPLAVLSCFCKHCSLGAGGPNQVIAKFPTDNVRISTAADDSIALFTLNDTSSAQPKEKAFCKTCGVPLWTVPAAAKGKAIIIRTAILDQGSELRPGCEIFVKNRPAWMSPSEGLAQFEGMRK